MTSAGGSEFLEVKAKNGKSKVGQKRAEGCKRKCGAAGLKPSSSTLGSLDTDFMDEPWRDPIRFEYDITILERDMLALCSDNNGNKTYSWRPGKPVPKVAVKLKQPSHHRPTTAGSVDTGKEELIETKRATSECILNLAGLSKRAPPEGICSLVNPPATAEAGINFSQSNFANTEDVNKNVQIEQEEKQAKLHSMAEREDMNETLNSDATCESGAGLENSGLENATTMSIEMQQDIRKDNEIVLPEIEENQNKTSSMVPSWFKQIVYSFTNATSKAEPNLAQPEPPGNENSSHDVPLAWTRRQDGIWVQKSNVSEEDQNTLTSRADDSPQLNENENTQNNNDSGVCKPQATLTEDDHSGESPPVLNIHNPLEFPSISTAEATVAANNESSPAANGDHGGEGRICGHAVDYIVASESRRDMLQTTGSHMNFDVTPTPSQIWTALTKPYPQQQGHEKIPLKMKSRSRIRENRLVHPNVSNAEILPYILGAPLRSARKVDSSLQTTPVNFVDSCLRIHPSVQIESSLRVDFTRFV